MFFSNKKQIDLIDCIIIEVSGMRFRHEYSILQKEDTAEVTRYEIKIRDGRDVKERDGSAEVSAAEILELCKNCDIVKWDGFHGAHPKNVSDGIMFSFKASVNNGEFQIHADGSENFPKHYKEFMSALDEYIRGQQA